ncbi:hypothetical protein KFV02_06540 [Desulfohalobiaceae bacterium Ax17]|uniref:hypothetical protein n=1 Tax=Desulfovulcanus ferrireducens TaxID=2831190 RepID=UPI00207BA51B|nr:hypothetical protein [Desulfovulcanus ferrireducens]MBT8763589.1 hypothetical protein [Desulfovulcanus ferrireducens]
MRKPCSANAIALEESNIFQYRGKILQYLPKGILYEVQKYLFKTTVKRYLVLDRKPKGITGQSGLT